MAYLTVFSFFLFFGIFFKENRRGFTPTVLYCKKERKAQKVFFYLETPTWLLDVHGLTCSG